MTDVRAPVVIRAMADEDRAEVYEIVRVVVDAGESYAYPSDLSLEEARALWAPGPPWQTVVAQRGGALVGTAKVGPNRSGRGSHVANASFMVATAHQNGGVGRALCEYVLALAIDEGYHGMQFNAVVSTNASAIALYRSLGFVTVGTVPEAFDHATEGPVGFDVMYRAL